MKRLLLNAVYCKISETNESLIVSLVKTCCIPILLYSLESVVLIASMVKSLDEPLYNALGKNFKTYDRDVLKQCMMYMNVLPLSLQYSCRKMNFSTKLFNTKNYLLKRLSWLHGRSELLNTCDTCSIDIDNALSAKVILWVFVNSFN